MRECWLIYSLIIRYKTHFFSSLLVETLPIRNVNIKIEIWYFQTLYIYCCLFNIFINFDFEFGLPPHNQHTHTHTAINGWRPLMMRRLFTWKVMISFAELSIDFIHNLTISKPVFYFFVDNRRKLKIYYV